MSRPLKERIQDALEKNGGRMGYFRLAEAVFPGNEYPRAWGRSANGGPFAFARSLGKALREMGCREINTERFGRGEIRLPLRAPSKEERSADAA